MRWISMFVLLGLLLPLLPVIQPEVEASAAYYTGYSTLANIYDQGDCPSMQGFAVHGDYLYSAKINATTEASAVIARTHRTSGTTSFLTNGSSGSTYFTNLGHANDLEVCTVVGLTTMFVTTTQTGSNSILRFVLNGTKAIKVANYNTTYNGSEIAFGGIQVMHSDENNITLLIKCDKGFYTGTVGVNQTSGTVQLTKLFDIDITDVTINGVSKDLSSFLQQGFDYHDHKIYVPMTGNTAANVSTIVVYDIQGASGTIKNDPNLSIWLESSTYAALFEIESCGISDRDGKLYFNTNRRVSSSNTNHDGVHYLSNFVYHPEDRTTAANNYRWETVNDKLVSVTEDGNTFNALAMHSGSISDGTYSSARYCTAQTVRLEHDRPWVMEWKDSGNWTSGMLFATQASDAYANAPYLYRRAGSSLIAFGVHTGTSYTNYGINLADHGIDGTAEHVYRLENKIASNGTNMVYLSVDGKNLGAMNRYYIGGNSQGTTSNWISGKDFCFSYMGTPTYPLDGCKLEYLQIWYDGVASEYDEPNIYRWGDYGNGLTAVAEPGLTTNEAELVAGSEAGGVYDKAQWQLNEEIVLLHDRPWAIQWKTKTPWTSSNLLFASHSRSKNEGAAYVFQRADGSLFAFGEVVDGAYHNYGLSLADYAIDASTNHTYRLTNQISADGSNMVYISVDGKQLGALNRFYIAGEDQGSTSNWICGKDFTFGYIGTSQHSLSGGGFEYLQVWEKGIPAEKIPEHYRWELQSDTWTNVTTGVFSANAVQPLAGTISGGIFSSCYYLMDKNVVLLHDRSWAVEWESEGTWIDKSNGALLLSSAKSADTDNAVYLYRRSNSEIIAFGYHHGGQHYNYGVHLGNADIDATASHRYRLTNRLASDGSNMVYLFVDDVEIGPLNQDYLGKDSQNMTANWISGKDFVFSYMGDQLYPIGNCSLKNLQISEGDKPKGTVEFRNWDGTLLSTAEYEYGQSVAEPAFPTRPADRVYRYTFTGWDKPVTACYGDCVYTAGYSQAYIDYTVSFRDWDGTVLQADTYHYGDVVSVPADPYRAEDDNCTYSFSGWDRDVTNCAGNDVYTAVYKATSKVLPSVQLKYPTISFEDEIVMNIYFAATDLGDVTVEDMGLLYWSSPQTTGTMENAENVSHGAAYVTEKGFYCVSTNGIAAKKIGDTIYFKVYIALPDGGYVYSTMQSYSPKTYAQSVLSSSGYTKDMKAVVVAMLHYGAQAQLFFHYHPYSLMNANLTADQKALVKDYSSSMVNAVVAPAASKLGAFAATATGFIRKYPTISFEGAFSINYYFTPDRTPVGGMKLYYWTADDYVSASKLAASNATGIMAMNGSGMSAYQAAVESIAAKDLDQTIYVAAVYSDGSATYCSGVLAYSIGSYCVSQAAKTGDDISGLAAATAVYGYYAKIYFGL